MAVLRLLFFPELFIFILTCLCSHAGRAETLLTSEAEETDSRRLFIFKYLREFRAKRALEAIYENGGGGNWSRKKGWLSRSHYCEWEGVSCSGIDVVTLNLADVGLKGTIPIEQLKKLPLLNTLNLSSNALTSTIPTTITYLGELKELDLSSNALTSTIPNQVGFVIKLEKLNLADNKFDGFIPRSIGLMMNLKELQLQKNNGLVGGMPLSVCASHVSWSLTNEKKDGESREGLISKMLTKYSDKKPDFLNLLPDSISTEDFLDLVKKLPYGNLERVIANCNIGFPCACCADGVQKCCYEGNKKKCTDSSD